MNPTSRLRALEYLIATIDEGGFAGAARKLGVSGPAVHKMVGALEQSMSVVLLLRDGGRLRLTPEGELYVQSARAAMGQLEQAERQIRLSSSGPSGRIRLALSHILGSSCIASRLYEFRTRYPEINLDLVTAGDNPDLNELEADVLVYLGWTKQQDCVMRNAAQTRLLIVASPDYWAEHGMPVSPGDLAHHQCITMRMLKRMVLDNWIFVKDKVKEEVSVDGWLVSEDRDWTLEACRHGAGVLRAPDIVVRQSIQRGDLQPALLDWEMAESPPIIICYRQAMRDIPRVRALVKFLTNVFKDEERASNAIVGRLPLQSEPMPPWMNRRRGGRASIVSRWDAPN
jgi:LysR family transcriptional regulator for bpeEF and oprC